MSPATPPPAATSPVIKIKTMIIPNVRGRLPGAPSNPRVSLRSSLSSATGENYRSPIPGQTSYFGNHQCSLGAAAAAAGRAAGSTAGGAEAGPGALTLASMRAATRADMRAATLADTRAATRADTEEA